MASRVTWARPETFQKMDDNAEMHARWRSGAEYPNSLKQSPQAIIEKLTGDTAKLQQMLAKLYPELARHQQLTTNIHA